LGDAREEFLTQKGEGLGQRYATTQQRGELAGEHAGVEGDQTRARHALAGDLAKEVQNAGESGAERGKQTTRLVF
jgi:hypothetical protein